MSTEEIRAMVFRYVTNQRLTETEVRGIQSELRKRGVVIELHEMYFLLGVFLSFNKEKFQQLMGINEIQVKGRNGKYQTIKFYV